MPAISKDVDYILALFFKCEKYRSLPYPGGVLSQPAWLMHLFDTIERVRDEIQSDKEQAAAAQAELRELKNHG